MYIEKIFYPELGTEVQFKVLDELEVVRFLDGVDSTQDPSFKFKVLDTLIFNLHTTIAESASFMSEMSVSAVLKSLFTGCIMLNPSLDLELWKTIASIDALFDTKGSIPTPGGLINCDDDDEDEDNFSRVDITDSLGIRELEAGPTPTRKTKGLTKTKVKGSRAFLRANLIGQEEAIDVIYQSLLIAQADLREGKAPVGVFLFSGASGVGKSLAAKLLQRHLFGDVPLVRIDCGEYQHKHESMKLLGAPPSYVGYDDGSTILNSINNNPHTVVLLDEVEKAHPDFWNTFLHIFDEGHVTDNQGMEVDFSNTIIIMTTNLGNDKTVESQNAKSVGFSTNTKKFLPSRQMVEKNTDEAIKTYFKPEFINRISEIIVFNHLTKDDLLEIAELELQKLQDLLAEKGIELVWDSEAKNDLVKHAQDSVKGARAITSTRVKRLDRAIAKMIVDNKIKRGDLVRIGSNLEIEA